MSYILPRPLCSVVGTESAEVRRLRDRIVTLERELVEAEEFPREDYVAIDRLERLEARVSALTEICRQILPLIDDPLIRYDLEAACSEVERPVSDP